MFLRIVFSQFFIAKCFRKSLLFNITLTSSFEGNFVNNIVHVSMKGKSQKIRLLKMIILCEDHPGQRLGSSQSTQL